MRLFHDQPELPAGLWLVKWIDRFQLGHDSEAPKLTYALQRLPFRTMAEVSQLGTKEVAELLGTKPKTRRDPVPTPSVIISRLLQAAWLPRFHVGDIVTTEEHHIGRLPFLTRSVVIDRNSIVDDLMIGSNAEPPADWNPAVNFRTLNHFEYQPSQVPGIFNSRCLVFRYRSTEYIVPKLVIFRAFYGQSSGLINALCSDSWEKAARNVISFKNYDSGISTSTEDGVWKIVLQSGELPSMAAPLALLWFDEFARIQANSLYTDSLIQNSGRRGGENAWYASANIPHRVDSLPFRMSLEGFGLRAFMPSRPSTAHERFLVTRISGYSWSLPNQLIEWELDRSNVPGEKRQLAEPGRFYGRSKPAVEGDPNAIGTSIEDPNPDDPVNIFSAPTIEYLSEPKLSRQRKATSQVFPAQAPFSSDGAASLVSAGDKTHAGASPAPAEVLARLRARSQQFEFLIHALEALQSEQMIESFEAVSTQEPGLALTRNGLPCWSLLAARDRRKRMTPKWGWEVIHERNSAQSSDVSSLGRHPRCALILRIGIRGRHLVLIEIEPRPNESAFCIVAFEQDQPLNQWTVPPMLDAIRQREGRFSSAELSASFAMMTANRVSSIRHFYSYAEVNGKKEGPAIGLRADILGKALIGALERHPRG